MNMKKLYLKTSAVLIFSFLFTFLLTKFVFYEEKPKLRPEFTRISERILRPIIGSKGEPIKAGVDPTPPASIYY